MYSCCLACMQLRSMALCMMTSRRQTSANPGLAEMAAGSSYRRVQRVQSRRRNYNNRRSTSFNNSRNNKAIIASATTVKRSKRKTKKPTWLKDFYLF